MSGSRQRGDLRNNSSWRRYNATGSALKPKHDLSVQSSLKTLAQITSLQNQHVKIHNNLSPKISKDFVSLIYLLTYICLV
jgi:hypothetical protein